MTKPLFQVIKATTRNINSIKVDGKTMAFGPKYGAFEVRDAGLAREIETSYGPKGRDHPGQVVVVPCNNVRGHEYGATFNHHYTFTVPDLPWKKSKEVIHDDSG